jgi:hypothetical protein
MTIMSGVETPLRHLLGELTHEYNETGVDPFEAYELLCHQLGKRGLWFDTYCSSSITSGGHARNDSLGMGDIIRKNTDSAHALCDELFDVQQLDPLASIEAVAVGKVNHWSQSDYMEYWLNVMARLPYTGANASQRMDVARNDFRQRLDHQEVDMASYNDPLLAPSDRVVQYMAHAGVFADMSRKHDASPVARLVRLIDTDQSLGAQTENYFARSMGSRVMRVAVAHIGDSTLPENYPAKHLVQDIQSIVKFGGNVFDPHRRTVTVLVPSQEH